MFSFNLLKEPNLLLQICSNGKSSITVKRKFFEGQLPACKQGAMWVEEDFKWTSLNRSWVTYQMEIIL